MREGSKCAASVLQRQQAAGTDNSTMPKLVRMKITQLSHNDTLGFRRRPPSTAPTLPPRWNRETVATFTWRLPNRPMTAAVTRSPGCSRPAASPGAAAFPEPLAACCGAAAACAAAAPSSAAPAQTPPRSCVSNRGRRARACSSSSRQAGRQAVGGCEERRSNAPAAPCPLRLPTHLTGFFS